MKKTILTSLAIVAACAASAAANELDGTISIGGSYANVHGQKAKFNEYRAIGSGAQGDLDLNYRDTQKFLDVDANMQIIEGKAADQSMATDNSFNLKGGMNDQFKLQLFYKEIPHNLTFDAQTFMNGVGTDSLTSPLAPATTAPTVVNTTGLWKNFDYSLMRRNLGAEAEISFKTPFFFLARVERQTTNGLQPFGWTTALRELPAPIDYTTDTLILQTGYRSNRLIATLDGAISNFRNEYEHFYVGQIGSGTAGYAYMPPDNQYYKIGGSIMYKLPFWSTTMMARASRSMLESNPLLRSETDVPVAVRGTKWDGSVIYNTASASIATTPINKLDVRLHYNFTGTDNQGDDLSYSTNATASSYNQIAAKYDHRKQTAGLDVAYKLPAATKLSAGYEYGNIRRANWAADPGLVTAAAPHATETTDHTVYIQAKNSMSDWVTAKLRYEHQFRSSEYPTLNLYTADNRMLYFRGFEAADKDMDAIKTELEFEPMHGLSLGLQYAFKKNRYTDSPLGLQDDTRHEFYADMSYNMGPAKFNVYGELELVESNGDFYAGDYGAAATTDDNFFWSSKRKDTNYALGSNIEADFIKATLKGTLGYRYERASGTNDFTVSNAAINEFNPTNIDYLDNCIKNSLNAKLTYQVDKTMSVDFGYLYEHLKYSDDAYTGYSYIPVAGQYLTGAYANPNYDASVFYTKLNFKF